jgi:2-polyprenyl-3-methyl-5-hydroxy-6-metoxy-1,4-benzoquinol methylase
MIVGIVDPTLASKPGWTVPSIIKDTRYRLVSEAGCGVGRFTARLSHISSGVLAFDLPEPALKLARKRQLRGVEFAAADLADLPLQGRTVDLVCCLEVLYYLPREQWQDTLLSLSRLVKSGGEFMVSAPIIGGP